MPIQVPAVPTQSIATALPSNKVTFDDKQAQTSMLETDF